MIYINIIYYILCVGAVCTCLCLLVPVHNKFISTIHYSMVGYTYRLQYVVDYIFFVTTYSTLYLLLSMYLVDTWSSQLVAVLLHGMWLRC